VLVLELLKVFKRIGFGGHKLIFDASSNQPFLFTSILIAIQEAKSAEQFRPIQHSLFKIKYFAYCKFALQGN